MATPKPKPTCTDGLAFLRVAAEGPANPAAHGRSALAGLTGQDSRALAAFTHLVELYGCSDDNGQRHALQALAHTAAAMQPQMRHLAKEVIARAMDWSDRDRVWAKIEEEAKSFSPTRLIFRSVGGYLPEAQRLPNLGPLACAFQDRGDQLCAHCGATATAYIHSAEAEVKRAAAFGPQAPAAPAAPHVPVLAKIESDFCRGAGAPPERRCCDRADEYNGFKSGQLLFTCPKACGCHD